MVSLGLDIVEVQAPSPGHTGRIYSEGMVLKDVHQTS